MRTLSTSTAPSYTERSQDRELPPMKLYTSKKAPLAFMAPWLVAYKKPEMTFPPPEEPHVSTSADSVRRLSILSSLNMPSQEGADLEIDTTPALGAEGPKNTTPPRAGFFRKLMDIILWRSDKKPKRKHEEVEKVEEKRFAGTPAAKKRRRVSSEPPTTAATKRRWSVEEMQDEQDGQDGEGGKGGLWSEDEGAEVARGVEEMQDEQDGQDEGVCVDIEEIVVEGVQGSSTIRDEEDTPESEGEGMGEHAMDGEEDSVEEMQDEQDEQDTPESEGKAIGEHAGDEDGEAGVEEMQDEQDGGNASSEEASVEEMQEKQDGEDASSEEASVEEMQDEQDGGNASSEEASVEEMQDEQDLLEDSSTVEDKVEKRQNQQDEEEEDSASEEPDDKKSISKAHGHDDAAAEDAVVDDDASSIPSSPQLDFSSDEDEDPHHQRKVVVHDDISETERADLERHADAIAAALSEEEKHGVVPMRGKKLGRRAAELKALQQSGIKPGLLYFHGLPDDEDSTPHECQFWMNQPLEIQLETWAKKWKPDLKDDFKFTTSVEEPSSPASRMPPSLLYVDAMKTPNEIAAFGLQEPAVIHMTFEH